MKSMAKSQLVFLCILMIFPSPYCYAMAYMPPPPWGQTVFWETVGNPEVLDPHIANDDFANWICTNVYETLFTYDWVSKDTDTPIPLLAESAHISSNQLNYTITLREGITFHDGTPLNASCVKYNLERVLAIFNEYGPAWLLAESILGGDVVANAVEVFGSGSAEHIGAYENWMEKNPILVLDDYTIRIQLAFPYAPFMKVLASPVSAIISPSYIEANGGIEIGIHNSWIEAHTCGTGPYTVDFWIRDDAIHLHRFENYWRSASSKVYFPYSGAIEDVIILTEEDEALRIIHLEEGQTDGCYWPTSQSDRIYNGLTGESLDGSVKSSNPDISLWCGEPIYRVRFAAFNMHPLINGTVGIILNPFANRSVRECFSYALNYSQLISNSVHGFGVQQRGLIPQGMLGYAAELFTFSFNLTKAASAWNQAMEGGWLDNVLASMNYELVFYYITWGPPFGEVLSLLLRDGISEMLSNELYGAMQPSEPLVISIQGIEWSNYNQYYMDNRLPIFFTGWTPSIADPDDFARHFTHSSSVWDERIGLSESDGWNSEVIDELVQEAISTLDSLSREEIYYEIQETLVQHSAYIYCYQETNFHVQISKLYGYVFNPMRNTYFFHMYKLTSDVTALSPLVEIAVVGGAISLIAVTIGIAVIIDRRSETLRGVGQVPQYPNGSNYTMG
ncbi:MAG: ABC transporter substrate-binding protein [Candidatus Thorarchaeota archaeon]